MDDYSNLLARIKSELKQGDKTQIKKNLKEKGISISLEAVGRSLRGIIKSATAQKVVDEALAIIKHRNEQKKKKSASLMTKMKAAGIVF